MIPANIPRLVPIGALESFNDSEVPIIVPKVSSEITRLILTFNCLALALVAWWDPRFLWDKDHK